MDTTDTPRPDPDTLTGMVKIGKNRTAKIVVLVSEEEKARIQAVADKTGEDGSGFLRRLGLTEVQRVEGLAPPAPKGGA